MVFPLQRITVELFTIKHYWCLVLEKIVTTLQMEHKLIDKSFTLQGKETIKSMKSR